MELRPKITILAEGPRGSLTKQVVNELNLDDGCNPQSYVTGVKEIWEIPKGRIKAGTIYHTLGFPLDMKTYGGGFIYAMTDEQVAIGLVTSLNYKDPRTDPHRNFQDYKTHPWIASLLKDGKMIRYGAKTISEGGFYAMPRLYDDGLMLIGESGGFLDSMRLKGVHLGFKSGMMAAQTAFEALSNCDYSAESLKGYQDRFEKSWAKQELRKVRNFHQPYEHGLMVGGIHTMAQLITGGRGFISKIDSRPDHESMKRISEVPGSDQPIERKFDGALTFDKLSDVYESGTLHEEDQPAHLHVKDTSICEDQCLKEFGNPCQYFCPAQVYEMVEDEEGKKHLHINASNCVHCKTCDIADPYGIITWVPPEGGGGPKYSGM
jgi:electron-transferring-flavoprotein dehydrogenase